MKIAIWPDGYWCEMWHQERYQAEQGRSDDYEVVQVPDSIEDVDAFVEAHLKKQGTSKCPENNALTHSINGSESLTSLEDIGSSAKKGMDVTPSVTAVEGIPI